MYWGVNSQNGRYCDWHRAWKAKGYFFGCELGEVNGDILFLELGDMLGCELGKMD